MRLEFRFAVVSDLHIALPHTIWDHPSRFHLVEISIPALQAILEHLCQLDLDFLLLPGDLTQHGEPANHVWLSQRLAELPFPVYVVPGNHDVPHLHANEHSIGVADFPYYYRSFGYEDPTRLYYTCEIYPGVRLIALNSNFFDQEGKLIGHIDDQQLQWLAAVLDQVRDEQVLVMVHHNVVEHLRGQSQHPWGQRYMVDNASALLRLLQAAGVQLVFTGHLHVQNIARRRGVYDITTGSLVSYPHPYRLLHFQADGSGQVLQIESLRVESVPGWPTLQATSRDWMGSRSQPMMAKFLASAPLTLPMAEAEALAPDLRYLWADIAAGDAVLEFPHFPPAARQYLEKLNRSLSTDRQDPALSDNTTTLRLEKVDRVASSAVAPSQVGMGN
jgi:3',5'-cyclic AMP phosphodiesterase CpdA